MKPGFIIFFLPFLCILLLAFHLDEHRSYATEKSASDQLFESIKAQINSKKFHHAGRQLLNAEKLYPNEERFKELKKKWVLEDYKYSLASDPKESIKRFYEIAPDVRKCQAGKLSRESVRVFAATMNYYRRLAGIYDTVSIDADLSRKAQSAALMMEANNQLSHAPNSKWKCFSKDGSIAASKGNLSLGYGFTDALKGQITDDGAGNQACGHRRWILNPFNKVFGLGSTEDAMCLYVIDTDKNSPSLKRDSAEIAWPGGYFPYELIPGRWSFSMASADFSKAKVTVSLAGKVLGLKKEAPYNGYALNTLVWQLTLAAEAGKEYTVTIENIQLYDALKGKNQSLRKQYKVIPLKAQ